MTHYTENTSNYIPVILGLLLASVLLFWWSSKETPKAKVEAPTAKPVVEKKKMPKAPLREFTSDGKCFFVHNLLFYSFLVTCTFCEFQS